MEKKHNHNTQYVIHHNDDRSSKDNSDSENENEEDSCNGTKESERELSIQCVVFVGSSQVCMLFVNVVITVDVRVVTTLLI